MNLHEALQDDRFEEQAKNIHDYLEFFLLEIEKDDWSGIIDSEMMAKYDRLAREAMGGITSEYEDLCDAYESAEQHKQSCSDAAKQIHIDEALEVING